MTARIDDLIARSSIGAGLRDIKERGIRAHLRDLEREMCRACRLMFRTRGVPCVRHTSPAERAARAKAVGVVR